MNPVLSVRNLVHAYGRGESRQQVLHGIGFDLAAGEFTALIGQSGSGKSTLLHLAGLLERPEGGEIRLDGTETTTLGDDDRTRLRNRKLGFVFQFHHLLPAFTALENVMMPLRIRGLAERELRDRATALMERAGLAGLERRFPAQLSGGQQQRVAIIRALMAKPALVLADEPTGNLDTGSTDRLFELMRDINRLDGTTFLIITHDNGLAARCDRRLVLRDGRLVADSRTAG